MIVTTIGIIGISGKILLTPSTAEEIEMAGVIKPSAISVAQPMSAGIMIHLSLRFFNNANKAKIPPSPLLSALSAKWMYLMVASKMSVQMTLESAPRINGSEICLPPSVIA